jgi:acetylornithine deacetylase/succinyl-diaminopimelate desuccinylase-like protein
MEILSGAARRLKEAIRPERLADTAIDLIAAPSPTGDAGAAAAALARILERDGFAVERPAAGHERSPAVLARLESGRTGPTLQWNGHLDTVHLPFVPPGAAAGRITGSGACDMKSGLAAAVEALRALRETGALAGGSVLLTAHDLHEAPWGRGEQLEGLIRSGLRGDAVLIPEPLSDRLPVAGRGAAVWRAVVRRPGPPVHEVMRPPGEPDVIAAGADLIARLGRLGADLGRRSDPVAGSESVFVGQVHAGEIYNQFPRECRIEGTRRWLPGAAVPDVEAELRAAAADVARASGAEVDLEFRPIRDAFRLDVECPLVAAFDEACDAAGKPLLPRGPKPFVDDGNTFWALARVPAITHGPLAGGQHTTEEWVSVDDLARVALVYALTAVAFCAGGRAREDGR